MYTEKGAKRSEKTGRGHRPLKYTKSKRVEAVVLILVSKLQPARLGRPYDERTNSN